MSACGYCNLEMQTADGCTGAPVIQAGKTLQPIRYGEETRFGADFGPSMKPDKRCHDCCAKKGEYHHPGCDMEECPSCHKQIISCGCLAED